MITRVLKTILKMILKTGLRIAYYDIDTYHSFPKLQKLICKQCWCVYFKILKYKLWFKLIYFQILSLLIRIKQDMQLKSCHL